MRPIYVWIIFGFSLVAMIITMFWVNNIVCELDLAQKKAQEQAYIEENVRLALWRLDSYLAPILAQENTTPYFYYNSFYPLERAYNKMFDSLYSEEFLIPSPLMTLNREEILLHFQITPDKEITSPQVPELDMNNAAQNGYTTAKQIDLYYNLLEQLKSKITREDCIQLIPENTTIKIQEDTQRKKTKKNYATSNLWEQKSESELEVRQQYKEHYSLNKALSRSVVASNVKEGVMKAAWINNNLFLIRKVSFDEQDYFQGCWLNWSKLQDNLLENIRDLLPQATLSPINDSKQRVLAMLPIYLSSGKLLIDTNNTLSPTRISLLVAWGCMFFATIAITMLLIGVVAISERRASFVSAVTHELRTPLTTFRMYTEMLHEGMVKSEEKQKKYYYTMLVEAKRLAHLVENVLSYARLEKKRTRKHLELKSVAEVITFMKNHLQQRTQQVGMELIIDSNEVLQKHVQTDCSIVEQIIFNLVDNACKYAYNSKERKILLQISATEKSILLKIQDYGDGLTKKQQKKLFRPFMKSAQEAACSAPGVGLGLALSRRLAKHIGGKLYFEKNGTGACFILELPQILEVK